MTNPTIARFTRGSRVLDINRPPYALDRGFVPPPTGVGPVLTGPTISDRLDGPERAGTLSDARDWTFDLHIDGGQHRIALAQADLNQFLAYAGDPDDPVYFEVRPGGRVSAVPLWGQRGNVRRYRVLFGKIDGLDPLSGSPVRVAYSPRNRVSLTLAPLAEGPEQRLAHARGTILQDDLGRLGARENGLILLPPVLNQITNPVFGAGTYDAGWTATSALETAENRVRRFCLPDARSSIRLAALAAGQRLTQSITLDTSSATHCLAAIIMRPDLGDPSADVDFYHNGAVAASFVDLGGGVWLAYGTFTSQAGAQPTGIAVNYGGDVYCLYCGVTETDYPVYPFWGDRLDCTWAGTAHESESNASAGGNPRWRLPYALDTFQIGVFTISIAVRHWHAQAATRWLWDMDGQIRAWIDTSDRINFTDGTNTAQSAALTFTPGALDHFHFTAGPNSELIAYRNGVAIANSGVYTPPGTLPADLYIGTDNLGGNAGWATIRELSIYQIEMSAAEVAADATETESIEGAASSLPCLWTYAGDGSIDPGTDETGSTGAPHRHYGVVMGAEGDAPADTRLYLLDGYNRVYIANLATPDWQNPDGSIYWNQGGTAGAVTDAEADYNEVNVTTTPAAIGQSPAGSLNAWNLRHILGREVYGACRINDQGGDLDLALSWYLDTASGSSDSFTGDYRREAWANTIFDGEITYPISLPARSALLLAAGVELNTQISLYASRPSGSGNVRCDYFGLLPSPLTILENAGGAAETVIRDRAIVHTGASGRVARNILRVVGAPLVFYPGQYNTILLHLSNTGGVSLSITDDLVFSEVYYRPKFGVYG